jgi:ribosomal protein L35
MKSHNLQKKSSKRRRGFRKEYEVARSDADSELWFHSGKVA